jgi:hypothetical protein
MAARAGFAALWLWVGVASAWDLALSVAAGPHLYELNPAGVLAIRWGGTAGLVFAKMTGTVASLGLLAWLRRVRPAWAMAAAAGAAAAQAAVVAFVLWA